MATLAFDTRLGLYEDPPPQEALEFTEAIINFFEISQQLLFDTFYQIASKYIDTPLFKKFLKNCDALLDIGGDFVNKKMMELKEMTEKGIDPAKTEGVLVALLFIQNNSQFKNKLKHAYLRRC